MQLQKISDDQPLDCIDVLRLASSLIIFTHSINNLRLASKVTDGCTLRHTVSNETRLDPKLILATFMDLYNFCLPSFIEKYLVR